MDDHAIIPLYHFRLSHYFWRIVKRALVLLPIAAFAICAPLANAASIATTVTDKANVPLDDAVVYVTPVSGTPSSKAARNAQLDQVNKEFVPYVMAVQTGTSVNFPNKDNIRHHVYSFSPAKTFELRLYSGTPSSPVIFDKPGPVVVGCNIHDWMVAYVYVVDTPYFAKTAKGGARIDSLPDAEYELRVWHPQLRGAVPMQRIRIGPGGAAHYTIALDIQPKPAVRKAAPSAESYK